VPDAAAVAGGVPERDPALRVAAHLQAPPGAGDLGIANGQKRAPAQAGGPVRGRRHADRAVLREAGSHGRLDCPDARRVAAGTVVPGVAGHKDPQRPDLASDIDETRRYLDATASIIEKSDDRAGFYASVKAQYPDRVNPWSIWLSALRLFTS
jgi:hypothetical protein